MKKKIVLAMSLVAALSLGVSGISFARGGGMGGGMVGGFSGGFGGSMGGGGFSASRGGAGPSGGYGFGGGGGFQSSRQATNAPTGGYVEQNQIRNKENIQHRNGAQGYADGSAVGNQQGQNNRSQVASYGNRNGGQRSDLNNNHREGFGATPAIPADPSTHGE